ncbi:J domain-containing protein [Silicimonas sp. MF1-12-2]|uniref:J domain-containing protein n=1 Tax=Silicimonas sp. MF1-12-2 TaxID=3384793 RepID=UPI0039B4EEC6
MTPIERVSVRSKALATLGLQGNPTKSEVRNVFRRLAFEKHPDKCKGADDEFARISEAYQMLFESAEDDTPKPPSASVSRPSVRPVEAVFDEQTIALCRALFEGTHEEASHHVATRLYRKGRMLTYFVPTSVLEGQNKVALPTGDLIDSRRVQTRLVDVHSADLAGNIFDVPAKICAEVFPGARSVQIRFGDAN